MHHEQHLDEALKEFERVAANLDKLEKVGGKMLGADEGTYGELLQAYVELIRAMPQLDGVTLESVPMTYSEIQLARFQALELGEPAHHIALEEEVNSPATELKDYRFRFNGERRRLVRSRVSAVVAMIDHVVDRMRILDSDGQSPCDPQWEELSGLYSELVRLVGDSTPRSARWQEFGRHLRFRESSDLRDIVSRDWPSVRREIQGNIYEEYEPIPVQAVDLSLLVGSQPSGPVATRLNWDKLDAEGFERVIFQLLVDAPGYVNLAWLTKTNAADRGRDIQVERVIDDSLSDRQTLRVIVQCKHWQSKSVGRNELILMVETVKLLEPPIVDTVIVATSGRFSSDAVEYAESRTRDRDVPRVELWSESHLEVLLSERPHIIASNGL